jgi:hypothetical protein
VNPERLNTELLAFMNFLESHDLSVCTHQQSIGFWPVGYSNADLVAAYMNVNTGGVR